MRLSRVHTPPARNAGAADVIVPALDGFALHARLWQRSERYRPAAVAIVNAGAGIGKEYYDRFAQFLAQRGIATLVYDYRGIGASRPRSLRGFATSVEQWGSLDCSGVLAWASERFPQSRRIVVGHSAGAFVTGFSQRGQLIDRMLFVGAHTGYWRDYAHRARPLMYLMWHVAMPALVRTVGYFPGRRLRLGDDLPAGVALEWAARKRPEFWWNFKDSRGAPDLRLRDELLARFERVRAPVLAMRSTDDAFATKAATQRIATLFANCCFETIDVSPSEVGQRRIGHFGFFRSRMQGTLWRRALHWLQDERARDEPMEGTYS